MRTLFLALVFSVLYSGTAPAQTSISGKIYNLHDGQPLEGTRVVLKNKNGITVLSQEPQYTDSKGFFAFEDLNEGDYRLEFTHVYQTRIGDTGLRVLTDEALTLADQDLEYDISLSKAILELQVASWLENEKRRIVVTSNQSALLGSRMIGKQNKSVRLMEFMEIIPRDNQAN